MVLGILFSYSCLWFWTNDKSFCMLPKEPLGLRVLNTSNCGILFNLWLKTLIEIYWFFVYNRYVYSKSKYKTLDSFTCCSWIGTYEALFDIYIDFWKQYDLRVKIILRIKVNIYKLHVSRNLINTSITQNSKRK